MCKKYNPNSPDLLLRIVVQLSYCELIVYPSSPDKVGPDMRGSESAEPLYLRK